MLEGTTTRIINKKNLSRPQKRRLRRQWPRPRIKKIFDPVSRPGLRQPEELPSIKEAGGDDDNDNNDGG